MSRKTIFINRKVPEAKTLDKNLNAINNRSVNFKDTVDQKSKITKVKEPNIDFDKGVANMVRENIPEKKIRRTY